MTPTRSQKFSTLQLQSPPKQWDPPITTFTDTGGSLRSAPRTNSLKSERDSFLNEKQFKQHSLENPKSATLTKYRDLSSNILMKSGVGTTVLLNSGGRELSPVRWCDREVDGVYLGRSGWVQVQQRSLDESKGVANDKGTASTLPNRIKLSNYHFNSEPVEGKERNRPLYLPLPLERHRNQENHTNPSFIQKLESMPSSSITPIISPPPAFKDPGLEMEYQGHSLRRSLHGKPPLLPRSKGIVDCESPPKSPLTEWNCENSLSDRFKNLSPPPVPTLYQQPDYSPHATHKNLENGSRKMRFRHRDATVPFSCFDFHSLDNNVGKKSILETDSSFEGYDDGEENHRDYVRLSPSSERLSGGMTSPSAFHHRNSQRNGKRTPGSASGSLKKFNKRSSSVESSSSSSCDRKSTNSCLQRINQKQNRQQGDKPFSWDSRNTRVRRSRSLQLPEKHSPNAPIQMTPGSGQSWDHMPSDYFQCQTPTGSNGMGQHRVLVTEGGESAPTVYSYDKSRGHMQKMPQMEGIKQKELLREAEEEARIISEFLSGSRSREAARSLLMHRYLNRPENESQSKPENVHYEPEYGVHFLGTKRRSQKSYQQPNEVPYINGSVSNGNMWSSSSCDFWPHCTTREKVVYSKSSPPPPLPPPNSTRNANLKSSMSYPSENKMERKDYKGENARSSPASIEAMNNFESKKNWRSDASNRLAPASVGLYSDSRIEKRHTTPEQKSKKLHKQNSEKIRSKLDNGAVKSFCKKITHSVSLGVGKDKEKDGKCAIPYEEESSSVSSSSSDICMMKSSKVNKSSEASSPLDDYGSAKSPIEDRDALEEGYMARPGSAPTNDEECVAVGVQQRSHSLPKFFSTERYGFKHNRQSNLPKRQLTGTRTPETDQWLPEEVSRTAPATPVRDLGNAKYKENLKKSQHPRSSSTPLLDESTNSNPEWTAQSDASHQEQSDNYVANIQSEDHREIPSSKSSVSSEGVLQKFKKSFSLRFSKAKENSKSDADSIDNPTEYTNEEESSVEIPLQKTRTRNAREEQNVADQKFRFGPLAWRSSKERKKGRKAIRNAKCNSRDSGIQMENSGNLAGDSSESHDTDLQDEIESPPMIRRRDPYAIEKSSRPQSEIINQVLINKFKADHQWRNQVKRHPGRGVRRTNSDLGGQRLFNWEVRNQYRRLIPSPIKGRYASKNLAKLDSESLVTLRNNRRLPGTSHLRRSVSQPLGLNELSPLMRRRHSLMKFQALSEDEHDPHGVTSEEDPVSDSESSIASLKDRKKSYELVMDEEVMVLAEAVWDHVAIELDELPFRAGDVIEVLDTSDRNWWWGTTGENFGYFPAAFVRLRVSQEDTVEDCLAAMASGKQTSTQLRRRTSISLLSNDQVRSSIVRELLNTERDFVKVLCDVTEGYVAECRRRKDMFTAAQISAIFSNLEDLLHFQKQFLNDLEARVDRESPHKSCIGETFLNHRSGFRMYSEYCNSHPTAIATLQELYQRNSYSKFFEACRLMRGLIEIPLDGYLLTPVQRICKYPLQLAELLKYTKPEHPDFAKVGEALEAMRGVANLINERKRKMESLEKLAAWQQRVEGWEGEDLIEVSSQLIHQGEAVRITSGMWTSNIMLFLFDHQIVYCKKDLLKRNTFVYKGRLCLDTSEIIDLPDGKDQQLGVAIRNGLKIYSCLKDKWLLFCCRSNADKLKWLEALAEERRIVTQDRQEGLELSLATRELARMAAKSKRRLPSKPKSKNYKVEPHYDTVDLRMNRSDAYGSKMGRRNWFTFGGGKKGLRINLRPRNSSQHVT